MLEVRYSSKFKKRFKNYRYNSKLILKLKEFFDQIIVGNLDRNWKDHQLLGEFSDYREKYIYSKMFF